MTTQADGFEPLGFHETEPVIHYFGECHFLGSFAVGLTLLELFQHFLFPGVGDGGLVVACLEADSIYIPSGIIAKTLGDSRSFFCTAVEVSVPGSTGSTRQ
jgi:hypothetical protein